MFTTRSIRIVLLVVFVLSVLLSACGDTDPVAVDVTKVAGETSCSMANTESCEVWSASQIASCQINAKTDDDKAVCKLHKAP